VTFQPDLGRDEYMFRLMGHRLSFVSSPDSDYDIAAGAAPDTDDSAVAGHRPARASSDPSIAAVDNIVPRPVEPPPAPPVPDVPPHLGYDPRYVCATHIAKLTVTVLCSNQSHIITQSAVGCHHCSIT